MIEPPNPRRSVRRRGLVAAAVVLAVLAAAVAITVFRASGPPPAPLAAPVDPIYPDLGMAPLTSILVGQDDARRAFLRFSAILVNVGEGPLLLAAHRNFPFGNDWRVVQRTDDRTGGYSERDTGERLVYGGDGHDHWHVVGAEAHQLETLDGTIVGGLVKSGFCFFDNVDRATGLAGAPGEPVHASSECGGRFDRDVAMGLSVGWGDEYQWYLLDQDIEITDVPDGRYRLRAIADPADRLKEIDETNNDTWTIVDLSTVNGIRRVDVVEQGPSA